MSKSTYKEINTHLEYSDSNLINMLKEIVEDLEKDTEYFVRSIKINIVDIPATGIAYNCFAEVVLSKYPCYGGIDG
jgi:hypothetical protein